MTGRLATRNVQIGDATIAYDEVGDGPPVLLLHGCPFSKFVWRNVVHGLSGSFRCIAPDLLGLGDTETAADADWTLPAQLRAVVRLLDHLELESVAVVGHDQGGAIAQMLAAGHPDRVASLVLADAEAYDNWPSAEELPFIRITQMPVLGRAVLWAWSRRRLFRWALAHGQAVADRSVLTEELVDGYIAANLATAHRRAKTRRFLSAQLDSANQAHTRRLAPSLARVHAPTLILWGELDVHFPPTWARRLQRDIAGAERVEILPGVGHLLMEERPSEVTNLINEFLTTATQPSPPSDS